VGAADVVGRDLLPVQPVLDVLPLRDDARPVPLAGRLRGILRGGVEVVDRSGEVVVLLVVRRVRVIEQLILRRAPVDLVELVGAAIEDPAVARVADVPLELELEVGELLLRRDVVGMAVLLQHAVHDLPAVLGAGRVAHLRRPVGLEDPPRVHALAVEQRLPRPRVRLRGRLSQEGGHHRHTYVRHARKVYHDPRAKGESWKTRTRAFPAGSSSKRPRSPGPASRSCRATCSAKASRLPRICSTSPASASGAWGTATWAPSRARTSSRSATWTGTTRASRSTDSRAISSSAAILRRRVRARRPSPIRRAARSRPRTISGWSIACRTRSTTATTARCSRSRKTSTRSSSPRPITCTPRSRRRRWISASTSTCRSRSAGRSRKRAISPRRPRPTRRSPRRWETRATPTARA